jgi:hypothetical protein
MPGFCSQTAYIFAVRMLPPIPTPLGPPCASIMTPCVRAAAVYAVSVTPLGSRASRLSQVSPLQRTSQIRRIARTPRGSQHTRSQRSMLSKWIAQVSLSSRKARVQRSSCHPRTPRRERPPRRPMVCRAGGFGSASGFLSTISESFTNRPSPFHLRQTHPHQHLLPLPSQPRAQASSTLKRTQLHR